MHPSVVWLATLASMLSAPGLGVHAIVYMYNHDSTRWLENGRSYELHVRWRDCHVTGCQDTGTLPDPVPCRTGYTKVGDVERECPRCDSSGRCPNCLPLDDHLCANFGLRVQDGNKTCQLFDVRRLYKIRRCAACHESCEDCEGTSATSCSSCKSRKILVGGRCIEPWVFVVAGALSGIFLCVVVAIILVIATRRKQRMEAVLSRNRKCSTSSRSDNSRWAEANSISGLLVRSLPENPAYGRHDELTREPSHYSAVPDGVELHTPLTRTIHAPSSLSSSHYQPLRSLSTDMDVSASRLASARPSVYESLQPQASGTYSKMAAATTTTATATGNPDTERSFQQRLASSHYAPLRPPLQPSYDATYAHPSPSRHRSHSMYTATLAGSRAAEQAAEMPEAAARNTDYFATAPTRGRLKAKKPLPLFNRWSCIAPASVDGRERGASGLHREPSWRFRAGPSQTDTLRKPDLWISSVTVGETGSAVNTATTRPENPAVVIHHAVDKQLSDPLTASHVPSSDPGVHRTSSFSHSASAHSRLSMEHTNAKLSPLGKSSPKSGRRFSPLISPLQIRKRIEKPAKADKPAKSAKSNKRPKVLPRWSMVPNRTLRLAEKRKQQDAWKNTASSSYEEAHVVSQLDTLSHYYHVLEKKQDPYDDFDERWQYGSNPSLSMRHPSQRVRKAMSLAPPGTAGRSQSLSRDDLLFVQSLVKECGLEGDHDIAIDDADHDIIIDDHDIIIDDDHEVAGDHDIMQDADVDASQGSSSSSSSSSTLAATIEESSETESREATLSRLREIVIPQEADDDDVATAHLTVPRDCASDGSDSDTSLAVPTVAREALVLSQHSASDDSDSDTSLAVPTAAKKALVLSQHSASDGSLATGSLRIASGAPVSPSDLPLPDSCSSASGDDSSEDSDDSTSDDRSSARTGDTLHALQRGRLSNSQDFQMMASDGLEDDQADFPNAWTAHD